MSDTDPLSPGGRDKTRQSLMMTSFVHPRCHALRPENMNFVELTHGRAPREIPRTELRGIMIEQLRDLLKFVMSFSGRSGGVLKGWYDPVRGDQLFFETINLYQLAHWVIRPMSLTFGCSYVEAVTVFPEQQRPAWFCSHWWGSPVLDFLNALERHVELRRPTCRTGAGTATAGHAAAIAGIVSTFWVCAYANNQNELGLELTSDPLQSSFFKAMQQCCGVLLVLESAGGSHGATALRRVWCCFEEAVVVLGMVGEKLFDIAAVKDGRAELLCDGLTEEDKRNGGLSAKARRETAFPLGMVLAGLRFRIRDAEASNPMDKMRILNCLAKRELSKPVDYDDPIYDKVDNLLAGRFAMAIMRQTLMQADSLTEQAKHEFSDIMQHTFGESSASVDLQGCSSLNDSSLRMICGMLPPGLQRLDLNFKDCAGLLSLGVMGTGLSALANLDSIYIDCTNCINLSSVSEVIQSLEGKRMKAVELNFTGCRCLATVCLPREASSFEDMTDLNLCCKDCINLSSVDVSCIKDMPHLRNLKLDFSGCSSLQMKGWFDSLSKHVLPSMQVTFTHADGTRRTWARQ